GDGEAAGAARSADPAGELAEEGGQGEAEGEGERGGVGEDAEVGAEAEQGEEEGDEEGVEGLDLLVEAALAALDEGPPVGLLQDEAGGEGADDGGEADRVRGPGEEEA